MSFLLPELILKYTLFYFFLHYLGRSFVILLNKFINGNYSLPKTILYIKSQLLFPIIGICFLGNLLILLNYFLPLKSPVVGVILFLLLLPNVLAKEILLLTENRLRNLFYFIVLPSILLISTYNTGFHYDAGYYHLPHQNWLRESNLILGMVNLFWPFGMSSVYEYFSAILWFDSSFVFLHFLTILFIHFLYLFISENLLNPNEKILRNVSFTILIFSILDNLGYGGGRNGFIYIQGVSKQDIAVGVLFLIISLIILLFLQKNTIKELDFSVLILLSFFIFQMKVSGVFIFYILGIFTILMLKNKIITFPNFIKINLPVLFFAFIWFLKSYLTTGCLIFPLSQTCFNSFDWYLIGTTEIYEVITKTSSLAFIDYYHSTQETYRDWIIDFLDYDFYKAVVVNYVFSIIVIFTLMKIMFLNNKPSKLIRNLSVSYIFFNGIYLIFYGPIPRYAIGILMFTVGFIAFYSGSLKYNIKPLIYYCLVFISVVFIVRSTSYLDMLNGGSLDLFDPRLEAEYIKVNEDWVVPDEGDQCWIKLDCSMEWIYNPNYIIYTEDESFFDIAYKVRTK